MEKMTPQQIYNAMPAETKVQLLEPKMAILISMAKDIHLNILNFGLMKKGSMAHEDFYKKYYQIFPQDKK